MKLINGFLISLLLLILPNVPPLVESYDPDPKIPEINDVLPPILETIVIDDYKISGNKIQIRNKLQLIPTTISLYGVGNNRNDDFTEYMNNLSRNNFKLSVDVVSTEWRHDIAIIKHGDIVINRELIRRGYIDEKDSGIKSWVFCEIEARTEGRGIWSTAREQKSFDIF